MEKSGLVETVLIDQLAVSHVCKSKSTEKLFIKFYWVKVMVCNVAFVAIITAIVPYLTDLC